MFGYSQVKHQSQTRIISVNIRNSVIYMNNARKFSTLTTFLLLKKNSDIKALKRKWVSIEKEYTSFGWTALKYLIVL